MTIYRVSELFGPTIQGEGLHSGMPCLFARFAGCNLWAKKDEPSKTCPWCDTPQLFNSTDMTIDEIVSRLRSMKGGRNLGLVISGGEPLLQLEQGLLDCLTNEFRWIDIETNGTLKPKFVRKTTTVFFSVSPKTNLLNVTPDWLKILVPDKLAVLEALKTRIRSLADVPIFLQPVDPSGKGDLVSNAYLDNVTKSIDLCYENGYRLSLQTHKLAGLK